MADPLTLLNQRCTDDWLIGGDRQVFTRHAQSVRRELLEHLSRCDRPLTVAIVERDPVKFLATAIAACTVPCHLFFANPDWGDREWQQMHRLVQPDRWFGMASPFPASACPPVPSSLPDFLIAIPTGGTSGTLRFAMHTWETLTASIKGFQQHFGVDRVNACCVLPLFHVSGWMSFLRAFVSDGRLAVQPFKSLETGDLDEQIEPESFVLSLVPTQLQRLLAKPQSAAWLSRFACVLLGGAPAWAELLEQARQRQIRLAPTYGMTETASQIATLKPEEFLAGVSGCGRVLPHAQIRILQEASPSDRVGRLRIQADSLALGYYPQPWANPWLEPDDLGYLDDRGYLHIAGRQSDKIITGGENVFPAEVEAAIRATGLVQDVCVIGVDDRHWGQAVTALYVPTGEGATERLQAALRQELSRYKQPKQWIAVETLPRTAQGKLNREQIRKMAQQAMSPIPPNPASAATLAAGDDGCESRAECRRDESALC